jgi:CubicO group peptidase (beta-lactamase class C family)
MTVDLPRTRAELGSGIAAGLQIGAQLSVRYGDRVADLAIGESRSGVAMTPDTVMLWLSATKPVAAVAIAQLWERESLSLDDPVARFVPEFAAHGKDRITIRHCLTHTAGIRPAANNFTRDGWDATIAKVCDAKIEAGWVPGHKAGYHVASTWFMLGEVVRRVDGRPFERYVREAIFEPLDMADSWCGMPPERYAEYGDRIGVMVNTDPAFRLPHQWDTAEMAALCKPGGNGRGPARDLVRFYQMILGGGSLDGVRIVSPQTIEALTARARVGMYDESFKHAMDWCLGLVPNNAQYGPDTVRYGYGPHASWRTTGHGGHQSSVAFADPSRHLAAAAIFNGTPGELAHDRRVRAVLAAVYEDLGVV